MGMHAVAPMTRSLGRISGGNFGGICWDAAKQAQRSGFTVDVEVFEIPWSQVWLAVDLAPCVTAQGCVCLWVCIMMINTVVVTTARSHHTYINNPVVIIRRHDDPLHISTNQCLACVTS